MSSPRLQRLPRDAGSPSADSPLYMAEGLSCPVCEEEMTNLGQLNRHLDDAHQTEFDTKDALVSWFRTAQRKVAATAAPLGRAATGTITALRVESVIGGGFELNPGADVASPAGAGAPQAALVSDATVTRAHWQKDGANDRCSTEGCGKYLSIRTGRHHCRKCGLLHCDTHSSYQMRLSPSALPDPVAGIWCRVCQKCYKEREGYRDTIGVSRNKTNVFLRMRKNRIDTLLLESNKLEKRLEKLSALYAEEEANGQSATGSPMLYGSAAAKSRRLEQSVVKWEDDTHVSACPLCTKQFGAFTNRRHHCRLCGRVVCGTNTCSSMVGLLVDDTRSNGPQIRVCADCKRVVTRRAEKYHDTASSNSIIPIYRSLVKYKSSVDELLPKFNGLLMTMSNRAVVEYEDSDYQLASRYRKSLMEWFSELDKLGKRIKLHPTSSKTTTRVLNALHLSIITYLQTHMFTLQLMPKVGAPAPPPKDSATSAFPTMDPAQLAVLQEQRKLVQGFLDDALRRRRFEDAAALRESLDELDREIKLGGAPG
ncbi:hypothetical protein PhCBS80983_g01517 [Powellomyces hirtus]|uniref:FYVE-type domain-containing protein n=1 Tax=Powellomyces hirtus TaxID=109895 RepID=A0A507EAL3_9FUNG|nr:hypothetical protein PhCBS80983_g01517 [Powellomyces hirtus]